MKLNNNIDANTAKFNDKNHYNSRKYEVKKLSDNIKSREMFNDQEKRRKREFSKAKKQIKSIKKQPN